MKIFWELSRNLSTCYPLILSVNFAIGGSLETHNNCLLTEVVPGSNPACLPMILGILGTLCYNLKANVIRFLRQNSLFYFLTLRLIDWLTLLVQLNKGEKVFFWKIRILLLLLFSTQVTFIHSWPFSCVYVWLMTLAIDLGHLAYNIIFYYTV